MTAPLPPTAGETPVGDRGGMQGGTGPDIQASLPDLGAAAASAKSAGDAWAAGAAQWADSPQGAGEGGFNLGGPTPGDWDSDVSFSHQGP